MTPFNNPDWHSLTAGTDQPRILCGWLEENGFPEIVQFVEAYWKIQREPLRDLVASEQCWSDWYAEPFGDFAAINMRTRKPIVYASRGRVYVRTSHKHGKQFVNGQVAFWLNADGFPYRVSVSSIALYGHVAEILAGFSANMQIRVSSGKDHSWRVAGWSSQISPGQKMRLLNEVQVRFTSRALKRFLPLVDATIVKLEERIVRDQTRPVTILKRPDMVAFVSELEGVSLSSNYAHDFLSELAQQAYLHQIKQVSEA